MLFSIVDFCYIDAANAFPKAHPLSYGDGEHYTLENRLRSTIILFVAQFYMHPPARINLSIVLGTNCLANSTILHDVLENIFYIVAAKFE